MGQVSAFLRRTQGGYSHWCPACSQMHGIAVERAQANGARWCFDGDVEAPTFVPSINISAIDDEEGVLFRCHYHLHAGVLKFCSDCTHGFAGRDVPLPMLPQEVRDQAAADPTKSG